MVARRGNGSPTKAPDFFWSREGNPGKDAASAVEDLYQNLPPSLDCRSGLVLAELKAILDEIGPARFNTMVEKTLGDKIDLNTSLLYREVWQTPLDTFQAPVGHFPIENLKPGMMVFFLGAPHGFAYHPNGVLNAFNLIYQGEVGGEHCFIGFDNKSEWTLTELKAEMLAAYNAPLTYSDLALLLDGKPEEQAVHSHLTKGEVLRTLKEQDPGAFAAALARVKSAGSGELTGLKPPQQGNIVGVVQYCTYLDGAALQRPDWTPGYEVHHLEPLTSPAPKVIPFDPKTAADFQMALPHQKEIFTAAQRFVGEIAIQKSFGGLIYFGSPGTGKTMACTGIVNHLARSEPTSGSVSAGKGLKVWRQDFFANDTLLPLKKQQELLVLSETKGQSAAIDAVKEYFSSQWQGCDLIYIDDTNLNFGPLAMVAAAAVRYCRETGKKIILNSNADPGHFLPGEIHYPVDSFIVQRVRAARKKSEKTSHKPLWTKCLSQLV